MHSPDCSIAPDDWPHGYGFCWCGCGKRTKMSTVTNPNRGIIAGRPRLWARGHIPLAERFWSKADRSGGPDACWPWLAYIDRGGYGRFRTENGQVSAHRMAYELAIGPIPDGLHIDHLCRNRACVNPVHMEPVTLQENSLRSPIVNGSKTHCKAGHPLSGDNLYIIPSTGARQCRECGRRITREIGRRRSIAVRGRVLPLPADRTHCPGGHAYTPENTRLYKGSRFCRACARAANRAYDERRRAEKAGH